MVERSLGAGALLLDLVRITALPSWGREVTLVRFSFLVCGLGITMKMPLTVLKEGLMGLTKIMCLSTRISVLRQS